MRRALESAGQPRTVAIADALTFRAARRNKFHGAAESERAFEINEGLAQYTETVVAAATRSKAIRSAIQQLTKAADEPTFVSQSAYPTGTG